MAKTETEINVTMELWEKAQEIETRAMRARDSESVKKAKVFKELLEGDILGDGGNTDNTRPEQDIDNNSTRPPQSSAPHSPLEKLLKANGGGEQG